MGTDIHIYGEVMKDGKAHKMAPLFVSRCYSLFSILANVRNGYGCAGVDTGDSLNVIAEPRGLPEDTSEEVRVEVAEWEDDGHTFSWLFLDELLFFDWTQEATKRGYLSMLEYDRWSQYHEMPPKEYCALVAGPEVEFISNTLADSIVAGRNGDEFPHTYTQLEWKQTYYSLCDRFWAEIMPILIHEQNKGNVRIVFWFDN